MADIRLQKLLADRGVVSRRHAAELIRAGRVALNGEIVTEPGHRVDSLVEDITIDLQRIPDPCQARRTIMLHKPCGYICSRKSQCETSHTVYELLSGIEERLVIAGRLDKDSEGLLLLSNDGALVHQLSHPRFNQHKTYLASVSGTVDTDALTRLGSRLRIDGYTIQRSTVRIVRRREDRTELEIILSEGRNRQIRKMCALVGLRVHRLQRIAIGNLGLGALASARWRDLSTTELRSLGQGAG